MSGDRPDYHSVHAIADLDYRCEHEYRGRPLARTLLGEAGEDARDILARLG